MAKKQFTKDTIWGLIIKNILLAAVVVAILVVVLVLSLRGYTKHGKEITVPDINGLYIEEAKITLSAEGLLLEVIDSTYSNKAPLGTIVEQNPIANSKVKEGRTIYVIQNARMRRPVVMPPMRDISLCQAEATLRSLIALYMSHQPIVISSSTFAAKEKW